MGMKTMDIALIGLAGFAVYKLVMAKGAEAGVPPGGGGNGGGSALSASIEPAGSGQAILVSGTLQLGDTPTIEAIPAAGYIFDYWEWDWGGTNAENPIAVTLTRAITVIVHFSPLYVA